MDLDETFGGYREYTKAEKEMLEKDRHRIRSSYPYRRTKDRGLLEMALDIHATNTGAYERSDEAQEADKAFIRERLKQWMPQWDNETPEHTQFWRFDEAVRNLLRTVLEED